jgi:methyl-accepting chemotaxis protein
VHREASIALERRPAREPRPTEESSMNYGGMLARAGHWVSLLLGSVTPSGIGPRFALAAALLTLAVALASGLHQPAWAIAAWILCLAAILLLVALYLAITSKFAKVAESLESIGLGELSGRVGTILEGESGRVVESVQQMNRDLAGVVEQVRSSSDRIALTSREIAAGSSDLSQRTEQQASTLEQIASAMQELATTVRHNSQHCQIAAKLTSESAELAASGAQCVRRAMHSMSLVDDSSRRIGEISKLIEGIALQTNILALNAAVEAARAGEQGRGFSIVAGEVRALAERCADAALDIKSLIEASVSDTRSGVAIVNDAGQVIDRVSARAQQAAGLIGEIAAASRDQSSGVEQVSRSLLQLEQVNLQNAALVERTSGAGRLFQEEARKLQEAVSHFKLDRAEGRHTAVALVRHGVAHLRAVGRRRACDDFDDPHGEFIFGEYYISAFDVHGIRVANGSDPASRGENIYDIRDADGKQHVRAMIAKAKARGKGWEDYKWTNPVTRRIEPKSVYFELVDEVIITCGIYRADAAAEHAVAPMTTLAGLLLPTKRRRYTTAQGAPERAQTALSNPHPDQRSDS